MKGKDGRNKVRINWRHVDKWLQAQANGTEIANHIGIHPNTLYRRCEEEHGISFSEYSQQKKSSGKMMLKVMQFEKAEEGNVPMQIWLGKNYLEQKDKVEKEIKGGRTINISITDELQEEKEETKEDQEEK